MFSPPKRDPNMRPCVIIRIRVMSRTVDLVATEKKTMLCLAVTRNVHWRFRVCLSYTIKLYK
jgi:hypothetical protein